MKLITDFIKERELIDFKVNRLKHSLKGRNLDKVIIKKDEVGYVIFISYNKVSHFYLERRIKAYSESQLFKNFPNTFRHPFLIKYSKNSNVRYAIYEYQSKNLFRKILTIFKLKRFLREYYLSTAFVANTIDTRNSIIEDFVNSFPSDYNNFILSDKLFFDFTEKLSTLSEIKVSSEHGDLTNNNIVSEKIIDWEFYRNFQLVGFDYLDLFGRHIIRDYKEINSLKMGLIHKINALIDEDASIPLIKHYFTNNSNTSGKLIVYYEKIKSEYCFQLFKGELVFEVHDYNYPGYFLEDIIQYLLNSLRLKSVFIRSSCLFFNNSQIIQEFVLNLKDYRDPFKKTTLNQVRRIERFFGNYHFKRLIVNNDFNEKAFKLVELFYLFKFDSHSTKYKESPEMFLSKYSITDIYFIEIGDEVVALALISNLGKTPYLDNLSFNQKYKKLSPGKLLILELIEFLSISGVEHLNFGRGFSNYKTQFGAIENDVFYGRIYRNRSYYWINRLRNLTGTIKSKISEKLLLITRK